MFDGKEQNQKKLSVFIVDDEAGPRQMLAGDLENCPEIGSVRSFSSYEEAVLPMLKLRPDLLFLDVELPGVGGLEFLDSIKERLAFPLHVVFYTAYSQYMIDAIRRRAFDFLLKPYKAEELKLILDRVMDNRGDMRHPFFPHAANLNPKIHVETAGKLLLLSDEDIVCADYDDASRTWQMLTADGETHRLRSSMKAAAILALSPNMLQVNKSCIVNATYAASLETSPMRLRLTPPFDDLCLPVSRRCAQVVRDKLAML